MKTTLKGASLVEALVASVIFLIVFLIAMSSLVNIARIKVSGPSPAEIEDAVEECITRLKYDSGNTRFYNYEWGVVEVDTKTYEMFDGVLDVTVSSKVKYGRTVIYRYIINNDDK